MNAAGQPLGDGDISREKLEQLLALGGELDDLDLKEFLDLSQTKDKVELVKDLGAFQSQPTGGYIDRPDGPRKQETCSTRAPGY